MKAPFTLSANGAESDVRPAGHAPGGSLPDSEERRAKAVRNFSMAMAVIVGLAAAATLVGWWFDVPFLKSVNAAWISMKPNTAIGFLFCSTGMALLGRRGSGGMSRRIAALLAVVSMGLGAISLCEYLFELDLGIDALIFHGVARMSPAGALCLMLAGAALLAACVPAGWRFRSPVLQALSLAIGIAGLFAIAGYISDLVQRFRLWSFTGMAMHEALLFVLLGAGLFVLSQRERRTEWSLNRRTTAGFVAGLVLMLGAVNLSFQFIGDMQRTGQRVAHRQEVLKELQELRSGIANLESSQRGYIITGNQGLLSDRPRIWSGILGDFGDVRRLTESDARQQENLARLEKLAAECANWEERTINARRYQGFDAAATMMAMRTGARLIDEIRGIIDEMSNREYTQLDADRESANTAVTVNYLLLPVGVFLSIVILLLCVFFLNAGTSERRRIEQSLEESELRYRDLVETSPNAIWVHQGNEITYINGAGLRLLRANEAPQVLGRPMLDFFHPDSHAVIRLRVAQLLRRPQVVPLSEEKLVALDGAAIPVETTAVSFIENGAIVIQMNCRDISQRKEAEENLRRMHAELEQRVAHRTAELRAANEELDSFCYAVSHDLRAPLRGIAGFTRILAESHGDKLDDEARGYFERVLAATGRMGELIDDLLNLSRVSREEFHREPVDMSRIAQTIADDFHNRTPERRVEWVIDPGMQTEGDPRLLRILLENLLGNAWKFTSKKNEARIEFSSHGFGGEREFCVRDNGAGFDMRFAGRLFGPFQRLHGMKEFPGSGIGLATVQRIIHRHGGHIHAEAAIDRGATFTFTTEPT